MKGLYTLIFAAAVIVLSCHAQAPALLKVWTDSSVCSYAPQIQHVANTNGSCSLLSESGVSFSYTLTCNSDQSWQGQYCQSTNCAAGSCNAIEGSDNECQYTGRSTRNEVHSFEVDCPPIGVCCCGDLSTHNCSV
eukprot:TRINITY_DN8446_c0_g2_i1.p1 TRINITY_DN8446_c0_g2~~TRINITY_DN8446_c0_g2_i1.p1  ORF type:complete len:135 (+),score=12.05 TRINITY_DN8446_c0_g2_i1:187-591(+)